QYVALLETEDVIITVTDDAIAEVASLAYRVNRQTENIGARRLHTIMERLCEDISFDAPDLEDKEILIDAAYVRDRLAGVVQDEDYSRYIL
ncbi:MAG: HslU--HslV peptidase ATPase subunit, partial [Nitrospinota bacterium]|nr:HslU--HslV peptidase ATPase subunit [Nitrospinota bacterium]